MRSWGTVGKVAFDTLIPLRSLDHLPATGLNTRAVVSSSPSIFSVLKKVKIALGHCVAIRANFVALYFFIAHYFCAVMWAWVSTFFWAIIKN